MRDTVERRMSIVAALCKRHSDTISNLATEYGVSDRTIRTDIASLSYSFPIYTQQGNGGGVFMNSGYKLGKRISDAGTGKFACEIKPDSGRTGGRNYRDYYP